MKNSENISGSSAAAAIKNELTDLVGVFDLVKPDIARLPRPVDYDQD